MTPYSPPLFAVCSSPACGNIKSEGGASAGCQETLCSPKWGYWSSDYGNKVTRRKTQRDLFSDFDYCCLSFALGF